MPSWRRLEGPILASGQAARSRQSSCPFHILNSSGISTQLGMLLNMTQWNAYVSTPCLLKLENGLPRGRRRGKVRIDMKVVTQYRSKHMRAVGEILIFSLEGCKEDPGHPEWTRLQRLPTACLARQKGSPGLVYLFRVDKSGRHVCCLGLCFR